MPSKNKHDNTIKKEYFNPKNPASFGGKGKLIKALKGKVKSTDVIDWLSGTDTYTLHKPVKKIFKRRKFITSGKDSLWQADLIDFPQLAKHNDNHRYILIVIDVFSRKLSARATQTKTASEVSRVFKEIIANENRKPIQLHTDQGSEFMGKQFQTMLRNYKIQHYVTRNDTKASLAERVIKSIKSKLFRYFTHSNSYRYVDVLQDFIHSYNNTVHSSIGMKPNEVNWDNQEDVWQLQYHNHHYNTNYNFNIGDRVRISKYSGKFDKGYIPLWSDEIFTISERHLTDPPVYSLKDDNDTVLLGTWYEHELQKVKKQDDTYKIESILGKRKLKGKIQYLVRWKGYPPSFDSYVDKKDILTNYKN